MTRNLLNEYAYIILNNLPEWNYTCTDKKVKESILNQKEVFMEEVKKIDITLPTEEQLTKLGQVIRQFVPDAHINIRTKTGSKVKRDIPTYQNNIAYQESNDLKIFEIPQKNKNPLTWLIGTKEINGTKVGIVAIPSFSYDEMQEETRKKFVDAFFQMKKENKWSSIIFDFRGNYGGDATVIKEISDRMKGAPVSYAEKTEIITPTPLYQEHKTIFKNKEHTVELPDFSIKGQEGDRFNGSIYILQDKCNASATEGAIYMLSQLKHTKTIGENTYGAFQGGATVELPMRYNTSLIIGTEYRERKTKNGHPIYENEGIPPHVQSESSKAYDTAISTLKSDIASKKTLLQKANNR